ncbi:MAG: tyrosine-type recombinase/integrase [Candidatus Omnitrophica bacterium]|nr:tyrosine-type recombinase/integrase [Candidatus Omnitrophota bacterium]
MEQIIPLFNSVERLEAQLKLGKESGDYSKDLEFYMTVEFLLSYKGSKDTVASYRRELEKLLLWSRMIFKKPIKSITRSDIEEFIEFCKKPPLSWIGLEVADRFIQQNGKEIPNPKWRPFVNKTGNVYKLSDSGVRALFAVLNSYFGFLIQQEYIFVNPVALIRQKKRFLRTTQELPRIRRISNVAKEYLIAEAERMAQENPHIHERTLFIIKALLAMYLRISELTENDRWQPKMNDFHKDTDGRWWFYTIGKGNKEGEISVSDQMLDALKRYRTHLGLSPLPSIDDDSPLIFKYRKGHGGITSTRQIRGIVQECFDRTVNILLKEGKEEDAHELRHATVHWLRHTGISEDIKSGRPREHVRDDARHSSSVITDRYIDVSKAERHDSAKDKKI